MTSAEIIALATNDPNRLARLIERAKMEGEEFQVACAVAGQHLPKEAIQRVLIRHLLKAKTAEEWEHVMSGLRWHIDGTLDSTIRKLRDASSSLVIRQCAIDWITDMEFDEEEPDPDDEAVQT
jgi:hypothetical protein